MDSLKQLGKEIRNTEIRIEKMRQGFYEYQQTFSELVTRQAELREELKLVEGRIRKLVNGHGKTDSKPNGRIYENGKAVKAMLNTRKLAASGKQSPLPQLVLQTLREAKRKLPIPLLRHRILSSGYVTHSGDFSSVLCSCLRRMKERGKVNRRDGFVSLAE